MFPRMHCPHCQVLWTDAGNDPDCWACAQPGVRTGAWEMPTRSYHRHNPTVYETEVRGVIVPVETAARPW